jgi:hypothetical protein
MTTSRWIELLCGLASAMFGFLVLAFQFFGPVVAYQSSSTNGITESGTTSYAQVAGGVAPIFLLFALPLLGIALGAIFHAALNIRAAQLLLWIATLLLILLAGLALLSIGPWLLPGVLLAIIASSLATTHRRPLAG